MRIRFVVTALALALAAEFAGAQQPQAQWSAVRPEVGERVRFRLVRAPARRHTGIVEQVTAEDVRLRVEGWRNSYSIRVAEFAELQVQRGYGSRARGAGVGALTGALIGGVLLALPKPEPSAWVGPQSRGEGAFLGAILGGFIGALIGAAAPGPLWVDVPLATPAPLTSP